MSKVLLPVGTLLLNGVYRVERQLSSGGFGNTYLVTKTAFNETFAMKEFFIRGINTREDGVVTVSVDDNKGSFQSQRRKFANEALRLHGLNHPNLVHVTDLFEENGTSYYVMDYIDGMSLKEYMLQLKRPMTEQEVRPILDQLLDALSYLHAQQPALLHLDIKPANIMLTKEGQVKLIDFGASKQVSLEDDLHHTLSTMCYTPGFAPTEQMEQITEMIGPWSDFYAVGATLYSVLAYKNPPSNTKLTFMKEKAFQFPDTISKDMRRLIAWMMNPDISLRPQRVEDIRATLGKVEEPLENPTPFMDDATVGINKENPVANDETVRVEKLAEVENSDPVKVEVSVSEKVEIPEPAEVKISDSGKEEPKKEENQEKEIIKSEEKEPITDTANKQENNDAQIPDEEQPQSPNKRFKWFFYVAGILAVGLIVMWIWNKEQNIPPLDASEINVEKETIEVNGVSFNMIHVKGGTFTMGATSEQGSDADDLEKPAHQVTLTDYSISETEVTQALWKAVMGSNPSEFTGNDNRPVESVSWDDCQEFITKLNRLTDRKFRLPTEAEWEYAARGGDRTHNTKYAGSSDISSVAWYIDNGGGETHPVKTKQPNELGLYDMSGNVWEWCNDWYGEYSSSSQTNPQGPSTGSDRVFRGGSWSFIAWCCRVAYRYSYSPGRSDGDLGLRLAL